MSKVETPFSQHLFPLPQPDKEKMEQVTSYSSTAAELPSVDRTEQPITAELLAEFRRAARRRQAAETSFKADLPTESFAYRVAKRAFDLAVCIALIPVIGVLLVLLCAFVAISSGFPIFYRQQRVGQHGKAFGIYKFRTMRNGSAQLLSDWFKTHPEAQQEWHRAHKLKLDPRITRGGRFLRETSLDELPQILNVLRGQMSLVGPRPVVEAELAKYKHRVVYYSAAVPGVTGLWQVSGRCSLTYEQRVRFDEQYVREWTLWQDISILLKTPGAVIRRDGAC